MTIKGIVFDKDGVLFDFRASWETWAEGFLLKAASGDRSRARAAGEAIGFDLENRRFSKQSIVIAGTLDEVAEALAPVLPDVPDLIGMQSAEAALAPQVETVPLRPLFKALKARGLRLGLATNDSTRPTLAHLRGANVLDCFDFVASSDSGFGAKPAPGQLLEFCTRMNLYPSETVMVGDSAHDMAAAEAGGLRRIAVLTGMASREDLAPLAEAVLDNIGHLPDWLDQDTG